MKNLLIIHLLILVFSLSHLAFAESQTNDYKGVTDPFGDPSNYEFSEDEKEDKEFFHLGRYIMLGVDVGLGAFTGGLGKTNATGLEVGGRLIYFFDKSIAFEAGIHYAKHEDTVQPSSTTLLRIDSTLLSITAALRYYFDTKNAPRAIAVANPYLVGGGGVYIRNQNVTANTLGVTLPSDASSNNFGIFPGAGVEFAIYRKHIYLGLDFRYHFIFFNDEDQTFNGRLQDGDRAGDYLTSVVTLTYNF